MGSIYLALIVISGGFSNVVMESLAFTKCKEFLDQLKCLVSFSRRVVLHVAAYFKDTQIKSQQSACNKG